jgi:hypothetical protein
VLRWLSQKPEFSQKYARAKQAQAEVMADEILDIADDSSKDAINTEEGKVYQNSEFINRSRLRVDSRKWLMSKMLPKKYGDRIENRITDGDGNPLPPVQFIFQPAPNCEPIKKDDNSHTAAQ